MLKGTKKQIERKVAIFDIDGTIFRSSLLIEITESLIKENIFPEKVRGTYEKEFKQWNDREGSYEDYIMAVVKAFLANIKGIDHSVFSKVAERVITENNNKVYIYTRDLVKELKKNDYYLLAISNSPQEMVQSFCKNLGFDKNKKIGSLSKEEIEKINSFVKKPNVPEYLLNRRKDFETGENKQMVGNDLELQKEFDIGRLKKIKSYRGQRHVLGLPMRGQRTRSHFRKNKKKGVGIKNKGKKEEKTVK